MYWITRWAFVWGQVLVLAQSCKTPSEHSNGSVVQSGLASQEETKKAQRFCDIGSDRQARDGQDIWGANSVQFYIKDLLHKPHVVDHSAASYALSYLRMTAERDRERCGGMLSGDDPQSELIGDLLADIMSRWLVLATDQCLKKTPQQNAGIGICSAMQRTVARRDDTARSAMELTSVYLSSHMASALAAVILADSMWNQSFPKDTHCISDQPCPQSAIAARIRHVRRYKSLYDKNNAFLGGQLQNAIRTLADACYLRPGVITAAGPIVNGLPINSFIFGKLRDQTFASAIELALTIRRQDHPMLALAQDGTWQVEYATVRNFTVTPSTLLHLESGARATFSSDALSWFLKPLGGQTQSDLNRLRPSLNPTCHYPPKGD